MMTQMKKEKGFTLIELMIVVAIIGILAAIAIPQFSSYRLKAFNAAAQADLRNVMTAEEASYAEAQEYYVVNTAIGATTATTATAVTNSIAATNAAGNAVSLPGAKLSKGVSLIIPSSTVTATDYNARTKHWLGDKIYTGKASTGITSATAATGSAVQ